MDQGPGSDESSNDDRDPEESDIAASVGDVAQAVNGGGLQELLDNLHDEGQEVTEGLKVHTVFSCLRATNCP